MGMSCQQCVSDYVSNPDIAPLYSGWACDRQLLRTGPCFLPRLLTARLRPGAPLTAPRPQGLENKNSPDCTLDNTLRNILNYVLWLQQWISGQRYTSVYACVSKTLSHTKSHIL